MHRIIVIIVMSTHKYKVVINVAFHIFNDADFHFFNTMLAISNKLTYMYNRTHKKVLTYKRISFVA